MAPGFCFLRAARLLLVEVLEVVIVREWLFVGVGELSKRCSFPRSTINCSDITHSVSNKQQASTATHCLCATHFHTWDLQASVTHLSCVSAPQLDQRYRTLPLVRLSSRRAAKSSLRAGETRPDNRWAAQPRHRPAEGLLPYRRDRQTLSNKLAASAALREATQSEQRLLWPRSLLLRVTAPCIHFHW